MKTLSTYIYEYFEENFKLDSDTKDYLIKLDREFNDLVNEFEHEHIHFANIKNISDSIDNLLKAVENDDEKFQLNLQYEHSKFEDNKWCNDFINRLNDLKLRFYDINCILTKHYIYRINKVIEQILFLNNFTKHPDSKGAVKNRPATTIYKKALELIKKNPYVDVEKLSKEDSDYEQNINAEEAKDILQKEIDKLGYGWDVVIDDNMVPRMAVRPYREFRINGKNKFSKVDIESLKVHEIAVHTARKYYSLQTGLFLFLQGLKDFNIYDEGLAIYNSLHKVKKPKPNILFYICMKTIILYLLYDHSIVDTFKQIKKLIDIDDRKIALAIIRVSRVYIYTPLGNYSFDADYLDGYLKVKEMTDDERELILKWPIGPDQVFELNGIKKFVEKNNFSPIKTSEISRDD